jgi:methylisocitrate lyase
MSQPTALSSAGAKLRAAIAAEKPLQVVGAINAYAARMAEATGFRALYLSGGGVAANSLGLPDLGISTMDDVLIDIRRITEASALPLLVDADTGWGSALGIRRTVQEFERAGVAGMHLEDQVAAKRCGHRPNKALVPAEEMVDRVKAAVDARSDTKFVVMARTDAAAGEGLAAAIDRAGAYVAAGADMIFAEALTSLEQYRGFTKAVRAPVLANITEFGKTPLATAKELGDAGARLVLYPLSAFRAMSRAAERVYAAIRNEGTQRGVLETMQTREELYDVLGYHEHEQLLDRLYPQDKK